MIKTKSTNRLRIANLKYKYRRICTKNQTG